MVDEFGLDIDGDIKTPGAYFDREMRYLCGLEFIIDYIEFHNDHCDVVKFTNELPKHPDTDYTWEISTDMIERVEEHESIEFSDSFMDSLMQKGGIGIGFRFD
ncbi:MAG: hypothetical protein IJV14_10720 [Lachnospiraceae bacterium]|nr:hypothetical protein [Lachnospiraceae bacterium]